MVWCLIINFFIAKKKKKEIPAIVVFESVVHWSTECWHWTFAVFVCNYYSFLTSMYSLRIAVFMVQRSYLLWHSSCHMSFLSWWDNSLLVNMNRYWTVMKKLISADGTVELIIPITGKNSCDLFCFCSAHQCENFFLWASDSKLQPCRRAQLLGEHAVSVTSITPFHLNLQSSFDSSLSKSCLPSFQ